MAFLHPMQLTPIFHKHQFHYYLPTHNSAIAPHFLLNKVFSLKAFFEPSIDCSDLPY